MTGASLYDRLFYQRQMDLSLSSASRIVPFLVDRLSPGSVVDVGCGVGQWLKTFHECGVRDLLGVDGDHVDRSLWALPMARFRAMDLTAPHPVGRRFDLAMSLEVAEHLPEKHAGDFVAYLCRLAPVVMFSAAIPGQGGVGHINEQWPEYWANHFLCHGYRPIDMVRPVFWQATDIAWWYIQNTIIYASPEALQRSDNLAREHRQTMSRQLAMVHPRRYLLSLPPDSPYDYPPAPPGLDYSIRH